MILKEPEHSFPFLLEQFADIKIMRYHVPGFDELNLEQKKLIYFLSEAALCGRDIIFDQNYKYNLTVRKTLEEIFRHYHGKRKDKEWENFIIYLKRLWFSNGIHHHYSTDKILPDFSEKYFSYLLENSPEAGFPLTEGESLDEFKRRIISIIFDPSIAPKRVSLDSEKDLVKNSACNFYEDISEEQVIGFYKQLKDSGEERPVSYGLNSKIIGINGQPEERKYRIGGMYSGAIKRIIYWLEKASDFAENDQQKAIINKLIDYYTTGDLRIWDEHNILWVNDNDSRVDFINGFIEVYGDPLGMKATWESVVNFKDIEATRRTEIISKHAQWFEDNSPVDDRFKKKKVRGISAKVITVAMLGGDCYPSTPIGINLPNADWIRKEYGSKSVTMENITYAYDQAALGSGFLEEFCADEEEVRLEKEYGFLAGNLHTDLHECLGHGSGQLLQGTSSEALKNYHSPLEESRADLFALYYIMDPKMAELGLIPDMNVARAEYNRYIRNGLMTQLTRIQPGKEIEQAHMRNRQLISKWCYEKGRENEVIAKFEKNGKTYFKVKDHLKLRHLFGQLLREVQRIKSEGDYETGKKLVETYAVKVDDKLHREVLERYAKLKLAPYGGFVNPRYIPDYEGDIIKNVRIEYPVDYNEQMLYYSENYSFLPIIN